MMTSTLNLITAAIMASFLAKPLAAADWGVATNCYNSGNFDCAMSEVMALYDEGRVVVGSGPLTTDSMTFFQMAFLEYSARAHHDDAFFEVSRYIVEQLARQPNRLPFVYQLNFLVLIDVCDGNPACDAEFVDLFCLVDEETPDPTWRPLNNTNALSAKGQVYFERLMDAEPDCKGV